MHDACPHPEQSTQTPGLYRQRRAHQTLYYQLVQSHLETWLATRREADPDVDPILLWVDRDGGHGGGKPLSLRIRDVADRWSFIMWQTGVYYGE